jgi:hypothetical protein
LLALPNGRALRAIELADRADGDHIAADSVREEPREPVRIDRIVQLL